jgi:hypothetical protein
MRSRFRSAIAPALVAALAMAAPAHATSESALAYTAGLQAYVQGYPPLLSAMSQSGFPPNTLVGIDATTTPQQTLVVLPNVDTAYTVGRLDLRAEPLVVHVPALPGRYYSLQLMDAYTNVFGYIGTRTTGSGAGDYAIVGPGYRGPLPAGMKALHSPTADVLLLGRTLVDGPADLLAVGDVLHEYTLTPLSRVAAGGARSPAVVLAAAPPRAAPVLPTGLAFFDAVDAILAQDPPSAAERRSLGPLRRFGIGPGIQTSTADLPAAVRAALIRAVKDGPARVAALVDANRRRSVRRNSGWVVLDPRTGDYGTDYDLRAAVARVGLWANTPAEATYAIASDDADGRPLSGAHRYRLAFGSPPPARAFWSLTMYDQGLHLYANPLARYALGDRSTTLVRGHGGSVAVDLRHRAPPGSTGNWLPAPAGRFTVALRLYVPRAAALDGRWRPPGIVCLDCRP